MLLGRPSCMCGEIVDKLSLAQSTDSQHLKTLKERGLIQGEIDGPKIGSTRQCRLCHVHQRSHKG